jgi:tetratricopeptide (TPR) repeat protein
MQTKKFQEGVNYCTKVLDIDDGLVEPRIIRGECYLALDEYEKAQNDFKTAHDADSQNQRVRNALILDNRRL